MQAPAPSTMMHLAGRSDRRGLAQLGIHVALLLGSGALVAWAEGVWLVPAVVLLGLVQAALFQWVNPKAWIIASGAILTYGRPWVLAVIFGLAAVGCLLGWAAIGLGTARLLRTPAALRWFNRAMAALLVLSLVPVVLG